MKKYLFILTALLFANTSFLSAQENIIFEIKKPQTFKTLSKEYIHQQELILKNGENWWQPDTVIFVTPDVRAIYKYNQSGYNTEIINQCPSSSSNEWLNNYAYIYDYNQNNKLTAQHHKYYSNNNWIDTQRFIYSYDNKGNLIKEFIEEYYNDIWHNLYVITYSYDNKNNLVLELEQEYVTQTALADVYKCEYSYDNKNNITSYTSYKWNESYLRWQKEENHIYTYTNNNKVAIHITQLGATNNEWENFERNIYKYNELDLCISILIEKWDIEQNIWEGLVEAIYEYNNNYLSYKLLKVYNNNAWVNSTKEIYSYNQKNCLATIITQSWINELWVDYATNTYLYDANNNLTEDILSSDYFDSKKYQYEYDDNNNGLKGHYYIFDGNEWINGQSIIKMYYNNMQSTHNDSRGCFSITISYTKTPKPSGLEEVEQSTQEITIYPNPSKDHINISAENAEIENVQIYNLTGKLVKQEKSNKININDLPVGMYIIKVETEVGNYIKKVVKD